MTNLTQESEAAIAQLRTVRDMVRWGATQFTRAEVCFGHGQDNPWDEALALARHVVKLPPQLMDKAADAALLQSEREQLAMLFQRRITERCPSAYLTHEAWFAGLPFYVDHRVIVPRSPLAEYIESGFTPWLDPIPAPRILDLCTGSGCIAIACALAFPNSLVDAVDISPEALAVAHKNVQNYGLGHRVRLVQSDLFEQVSGRYDLIISNPPYVNAADMQALPTEFRHEPVLALAAGEDGLDIVRSILAKARSFLSESGILVVEVGDSEAALQMAFPEHPFLWLEFQRGGHGVFLLTADQV